MTAVGGPPALTMIGADTAAACVGDSCQVPAVVATDGAQTADPQADVSEPEASQTGDRVEE